MPIAGDTETTGLLRPKDTEKHLQPFATELYFCKFDENYEIYDEFETFIKPPVPVPEEVVKITGITNEMLRNAPKFIEVYDDLCRFFLGEEVFFAHNCAFDINIIAHELERHDLEYKFPWPSRQICTVEASFPIQNKRMKLGNLHKLATGADLMNAHRAKGDVHGLVRCIKWLSEKGLVKV